jgi:hypothetical protein
MTNAEPTREELNAHCANSVAPLVALFRHERGTDQENAVCDMVCNLMHYAQRAGMDPVAEIERAIRHWYEETNDDGALLTNPTVEVKIHDLTKQTKN